MTEEYTETRTFDSDSEMSIFGVAGRLKTRSVRSKTKVGCWEHQEWISERRTKVLANGEKVLMHAEIRFDDNCHNGHNSFAITGHGWYGRYKSRDWDFGGCCHEMIAEVFPELEPLIKWHLMDTDSPMHYVANTVYHASNLDKGKAKGEPNRWQRRFRFKAFPAMTFELPEALIDTLLEVQDTRTAPGVLDLIEIPYTGKDNSHGIFTPHYTLACYPVTEWYKAPFKTKSEALEWQTSLLDPAGYEEARIVTGYSQGKKRDLDAARRCAKWPEATDEQLCLPAAELTKLLEARLPAMIAEFRQTMESIGMLWSPEDFK